MDGFVFPEEFLQYEIPANKQITRVHSLAFGPVWFGPKKGHPPNYRFDAPAGEYQTLYASDSLEGAFVETILRNQGSRILTRSFINDRGYSLLKTQRKLTLARVFGEGLLWHGVDSSISGSGSYAASRRFALALHSKYGNCDGIAYLARHDNTRVCFALFDRVKRRDIIASQPVNFADREAEVDALLARYGAVLDPDTPLSPP